MATQRTLHRLGITAVLSALTLALVAAPTAAAGKTRVVDNDGKGSATNCDATIKAFLSIQKAVDASAAGDIVKVCPGTYKGRVKVTGARAGLQLLSTKALGATIKDPGIYMPQLLPLVSIDGVDGVVLKGFKVRTLSWESYLSQTMDGIVANDAKNVSIRANDLGWLGASGDRSNLSTGITAKGGTTGLIKGNTIKDPLQDGIVVTGAGTDVTVEANTVDIVFAANESSADDGIEIQTSALARVKGNTIKVPPVASGIITKLASGVELYNANGATVVSGNTITNPISGIVTRGNGYDIKDNTVIGRQVGINIVNSDSLLVSGNTARATKSSPGYGIATTEASDDSIITSNNVKNSAGPDCFEENTTGGIDNSWSLNQTNDSPVNALCTYDIEPPA